MKLLKVTDIENNNKSNLPVNHPLRNKVFRQKVSIVLHDVFGLKFTLKNYKEIDNWYHWESLYQSIANPSFDCRVYLLSDNPNIAEVGRVMDGAEYLTARVSLPGATPEIALENMDKRMYGFIRWCSAPEGK
jgi:hypothetical protein